MRVKVSLHAYLTQQTTRFSNRLRAVLVRYYSAANALFRRITQSARSNRVTGTLADLPRRRSELLAENALLRQHLIELHRQVETPGLTCRERLSLLLLTRWVSNWQQILQIVQPNTLLR
jgi:hypothetical protein